MIYLWNFHSRWPWSKYVDCFAFSRSQLNNRKVKWWEIQFYNNKWAERCHQQTISVNFWKNKGEGRWQSWDGIEIQRSHSSEMCGRVPEPHLELAVLQNPQGAQAWRLSHPRGRNEMCSWKQVTVWRSICGIHQIIGISWRKWGSQ